MKQTSMLLTALVVVLTTGCNLPNPTPTLPPCSVDHLIESIEAANTTPATTDIIDLDPGCVYELTSVHNTTNGPNGLPVISSHIIINGHGAVITRLASSVETFRIFMIEGNGNLEINDVTLSGGYAKDPADPNEPQKNSGGAILNMRQLSVQNSLISGNSAREGGGIFNFGNMSLIKVTVDSNHDYLGLPGGAGIFNMGDALIDSSTISNNGKPEGYDGIFNQSTLEMVNSTVSSNGGSGIDNEGELILNHVTIALNEAGALGSAGDVYLTNSLIADEGCTGNTIHPVYPNIDIDGTCGGLTVPVGAIELGPLTDNGGNTLTHALGAGSAAIDLVVRQCLPTDQRGETRPSGPKCDVGSFEYTGLVAPQIGSTETPTLVFTDTPPPQVCTFTAGMNLFCRSGPAASAYPVVDSFIKGQSAPVTGQSADGKFLYVAGPNNGLSCAVPNAESFGTTRGDCQELAVFTPVPPPITPTTEKQGEDSSPSACYVRRPSGALECVSPCPTGAIPGTPCTP